LTQNLSSLISSQNEKKERIRNVMFFYFKVCFRGEKTHYLLQILNTVMQKKNVGIVKNIGI